MEWQETSCSKEIPNFETWAKAFRAYAALYLSYYPDKSVELLKYQGLIKKASLSYKWKAVLTYDFYFRQNLADYPLQPWGSPTQSCTLIVSPTGTWSSRAKRASPHKDPTPWSFNQPASSTTRDFVNGRTAAISTNAMFVAKQATLQPSASNQEPLSRFLKCSLHQHSRADFLGPWQDLYSPS